MNRQYSYNWLKEYIKTDKSAHEFAKELSLRSMTVDRVEKLGKGLEKIVVGKIMEIKMKFLSKKAKPTS